MDPIQLIKAFTATVQASLHGLNSLEAVLTREQAALIGRDPDALQQVVGEKLALLKEVASSVQARDRLQRAAGVAVGNGGGDRLVEQARDPGLAADWQAMTSLAQRVAEHNDRNGQLAMQGQRTTRTALGILTGRPTGDDTYEGLRRRRSGTEHYTLGKV